MIGTLSASNYAQFVSHRHSEGHVSNVFTSNAKHLFLIDDLQAHFSVYATPKAGNPWGAFTTDTEVPPELGPSYDEASDSVLDQESKVSSYGGPWDAVLLARLRFKPDVLEPTSK